MTCNPPPFNNNLVRYYPKLSKYFTGDVIYFHEIDDFTSGESVCNANGVWSLPPPKVKFYEENGNFVVTCKYPQSLFNVNNERIESVSIFNRMDDIKQLSCYGSLKKKDFITLKRKNNNVGILLLCCLGVISLLYGIFNFTTPQQRQQVVVQVPQEPEPEIFDPMTYGMLII